MDSLTNRFNENVQSYNRHIEQNNPIQNLLSQGEEAKEAGINVGALPQGATLA